MEEVAEGYYINIDYPNSINKIKAASAEECRTLISEMCYSSRVEAPKHLWVSLNSTAIEAYWLVQFKETHLFGWVVNHGELSNHLFHMLIGRTRR